MCTVIKVKRKITDDPVDCLILECKKRKKLISDLQEDETETSDNSNSKLEAANRIDSIKQILKYAGSAKNENEISERLIELSSDLKSTIDNFIKNPKTPKPNNLKQINQNEVKKEIKSQRYILLNKKRGIDNLDTNTIEKISNKEATLDRTELAINKYGDMNILDVVSSEIHDEEEEEIGGSKSMKRSNEKIVCNGVELLKEKVINEYVYDIYYAKNQDIHLDLLYPSNFTINSFDLEFEENDEADEFYEDDEDSNDEGNWRNDYPDEDESDIDGVDDQDGIGNRYFHDFNGYDEDGDHKLSEAFGKNCNLDGSYYEDEECSDDYEEYNNEDSKSYSAYKKKLIKDLDK